MARITLAADAFDSMSRGRGYRRGVSAEVALEEVARHSGTQFDPAVVHALLDVLTDDERQATGNGAGRGLRAPLPAH